MELKNQVVSLEIAKKLKALGVKQESLYSHWIMEKEYQEIVDGSWAEDERRQRDERYEFASAFTVAELGEMLPDTITNPISKNKLCIVSGKSITWWCRYENTYREEVPIQFGWDGETEADARGKMLMYLLENNLLPNPK